MGKGRQICLDYEICYTSVYLREVYSPRKAALQKLVSAILYLAKARGYLSRPLMGSEKGNLSNREG